MARTPPRPRPGRKPGTRTVGAEPTERQPRPATASPGRYRSKHAAARGLGLALLTSIGAAVAGVLLARFAATAIIELSGAAGTGSRSGLAAGVSAAVAAVGALVAAWYALSSLAGAGCALARLAQVTWRAGEEWLVYRGAPGVARLVGAGTGAVLVAGLALAPAQADLPSPDPTPVLAEDLTWAGAVDDPPGPQDPEPSGPTDTSTGEPTESPVGGAARPENTPEPAPTALPGRASGAVGEPLPVGRPAGDAPVQPSEPPSRSAEHPRRPQYVIRAGDTLWSIAAAHLGGTATAAQIATEWPRWYAANRQAIGSDPNLIHPGTVLHAPD